MNWSRGRVLYPHRPDYGRWSSEQSAVSPESRESDERC
ncbi:hypothetical protein BN126350073 [Stenotrophomonas maltophilia]|nr:hypothetical protein BN126350073 [Stenotrophomonas maltophilia]